MKKLEIKQLKIKIIFITLGVFTLLLRFIFNWNPQLTESLYSKGIFGGIRFILDHSFVLLPFPLLYLLGIVLLTLLLRKIVNWIKMKRQKCQEKLSVGTRFIHKGISILAFVGLVIFLFYFLWGFNYERVSIEDHLNLKLEPLEIESIRNEANSSLKLIIKSREEISGIEKIGMKALSEKFLPHHWEDKIRESLVRVLHTMNYPTFGHVRVKKIWPGGLLMGLGSSGIYFPFTGESYIPANLTPVEIPFVVAHEMAHGYGFSQEGTANFLAYLTCISSEDPFIKYSGYLEYYSHITGDLYRASPAEYKKLNNQLPPGIHSDRLKIYKNWQRYRGWLMDWSEKVYDSYLKSQGINEGIKSYNRLVVLVTAWQKVNQEKKEKYENLDQVRLEGK